MHFNRKTREIENTDWNVKANKVILVNIEILYTRRQSTKIVLSPKRYIYIEKVNRNLNNFYWTIKQSNVFWRHIIKKLRKTCKSHYFCNYRMLGIFFEYIYRKNNFFDFSANKCHQNWQWSLFTPSYTSSMIAVFIILFFYSVY